MAKGEEPHVALVRELHEELGIVADVVGEPFAHVQGADFRMDVWVVDHWVGAPVNAATSRGGPGECSSLVVQGRV